MKKIIFLKNFFLKKKEEKIYIKINIKGKWVIVNIISFISTKGSSLKILHILERVTRFELVTSTLATWCMTRERIHFRHFLCSSNNYTIKSRKRFIKIGHELSHKFKESLGDFWTIYGNLLTPTHQMWLTTTLRFTFR